MIFLILLGLLSGIVSGMGIGGGTILIPALSILLGLNQQTAQGVNLVYFIPTACIALVTHNKNKSIQKHILWKIVVSGVLGAVIGSFIAIQIQPALLRRMFGFFLLCMGVLELCKKEKNK